MTRKPSAVSKIESAIDAHTGTDDQHSNPDHARTGRAQSDPHTYPDTEAGDGVTLGELYERQRHESADRTAAAIVPLTAGQGKGAVFGIVVGAAIGALLFWPLGFISWGTDVSLGLRILTAAVIGAIAGSTAGVVYWGGRGPELDGETKAADGSPGVGTTPADPYTDDRGRPADTSDNAPTRSTDPATGAVPGSRRRGSP